MKKTSISTVIAATCVLAFTVFDLPATESDEAKPWREIASGTYSAIEEETRMVIQSQEQWLTWWKEHTKNMFDAAHPDGQPPPKVDFEKETVLIATLGMRSTGGHQIQFSDVSRKGESMTVTLTTTSPGPDDMVTMALTYPFAVIAIAKHTGVVEFVVK